MSPAEKEPIFRLRLSSSELLDAFGAESLERMDETADRVSSFRRCVRTTRNWTNRKNSTRSIVPFLSLSKIPANSRQWRSSISQGWPCESSAMSVPIG